MPEKVLVTREIPEAGLRPLRGFDLAVLSEAPPERGALLGAARGAAGVLSNVTGTIDAEFMDAAGGGLKVVANMAVGHDDVDVGRGENLVGDAASDTVAASQAGVQAAMSASVIAATTSAADSCSTSASSSC